MPKLLTKRKQAWADKFKPDILRGGALTPNAGTAARYYARLAALIDKMTSQTERELRKFFEKPHAEEYFGEDADVSAQAKILTNYLMRTFQKLFDLKSKVYADGMVRDADADSSKSLHMSLKDLSGGLSLKTNIAGGAIESVIAASVTENVNLIRTISSQYLDGVQQAVMRSITTGNGLEDLVPFLQKHKGITLRRARIIAEDQSRKAFSNISRTRMQKLGLKQFEWLHSRGSLEPRKLHLEYNGKIFSLDEPPVIDEKTGERGYPGTLINCKCRMKAVISFAGEDDA